MGNMASYNKVKFFHLYVVRGWVAPRARGSTYL